MGIEDASQAVYSGGRIAMKSIVNIYLLVESIAVDGTVLSIDSLREFMKEKVMGKNLTQHIPLQFPAPVFISKYRHSALSDQRSQLNLMIKKSSIRLSQRVVAKAEFYGDVKAGMDDIMVEIDENIDLTMKNTHFQVWLARAKALVRTPDTVRQISKERDGSSCRFRLSVVKSEFCVMQFYDMIPCCKLRGYVGQKTAFRYSKMGTQRRCPRYTRCL